MATTIFEPCLHWYQRRLDELLSYALLVGPQARDNREAHKVLVDSLVVLTVAILEEFLKTVLGFACLKRESVLREHLAANGNEQERASASTCDRIAIVRMVRRRVSFKDKAKPLKTVFSIALGCSPWPSAAAETLVLDLVHLRRVMIHEGGLPSEQSAIQFATQSIITRTEYGDLAPYRVDQNGALMLWGNATNVRRIVVRLRCLASR